MHRAYSNKQEIKKHIMYIVYIPNSPPHNSPTVFKSPLFSFIVLETSFTKEVSEKCTATNSVTEQVRWICAACCPLVAGGGSVLQERVCGRASWREGPSWGPCHKGVIGHARAGHRLPKGRHGGLVLSVDGEGRAIGLGVVPRLRVRDGGLARKLLLEVSAETGREAVGRGIPEAGGHAHRASTKGGCHWSSPVGLEGIGRHFRGHSSSNERICGRYSSKARLHCG